MNAVISVIGKDNVGIIAKVSQDCAACGVNILDISQSVMKDYFAMIMLVNIDKMNIPFPSFADRLAELGRTLGLEIHAMHEDIFNVMHNI